MNSIRFFTFGLLTTFRGGLNLFYSNLQSSFRYPLRKNVRTTYVSCTSNGIYHNYHNDFWMDDTHFIAIHVIFEIYPSSCCRRSRRKTLMRETRKEIVFFFFHPSHQHVYLPHAERMSGGGNAIFYPVKVIIAGGGFGSSSSRSL